MLGNGRNNEGRVHKLPWRYQVLHKKGHSTSRDSFPRVESFMVAFGYTIKAPITGHQQSNDVPKRATSPRIPVVHSTASSVCGEK
jgi:hypothetical protein